MKHIYKITNKINGRVYIGQTNNIERRFKEHKSRAFLKDHPESNKLLYKAFRKHGIENFDFEVLEMNSPLEAKREEYWIDYYNSFSNGYNETEGGENPPIGSHAKITEETVKEIVGLLKNTDLSLIEISNELDVSIESVRKINVGKTWTKLTKNEGFPIRKKFKQNKAKNQIDQIIYDLKHTNLPQKEIAKKYGISRTAVTAINLGKNGKIDGEKYPIRKGRICVDLDSIVNDILHTNLTFSEIAQKNGVNVCTVSKVNLGGIKGFVSERQYKFPLREWENNKKVI